MLGTSQRVFPINPVSGAHVQHLSLSLSFSKNKICSTALPVFLLLALIFKRKVQTKKNGSSNGFLRLC